MKENDWIDRYFDGSRPLPFPEEDLDALLTEDLSEEYEAIVAARRRAQRVVRFRLYAGGLSAAAILALAILLWPRELVEDSTRTSSSEVTTTAATVPQAASSPSGTAPTTEAKSPTMAEAQPLPIAEATSLPPQPMMAAAATGSPHRRPKAAPSASVTTAATDGAALDEDWTETAAATAPSITAAIDAETLEALSAAEAAAMQRVMEAQMQTLAACESPHLAS